MCSISEKRLIKQTFRFELDPNRAQRVMLAKSVGASRFVYNWGLAESQREYELTGRRPRLSELKSRLVEFKKTECPWLYEVSAHISQQALVDLDWAFERFFERLKSQAPKSGFPRFKKKGRHESARLYEVSLEARHIRLPMIGRVRLKETRAERGFDGRILSATIIRRADRWFVALAVEREREVAVAKPVKRASDVVGVDLGLASAAVIHDGTETRTLEASRRLRKNLAKLRRLDRQLSRKQKGSRNREKAKLRRARLHYKISCQRNDFLHKLSSELARTKSVIVLEDLHVKGMQRNRSLALSISDAAMGKLRRQLAYKSEWYGARLIVADRFFPSSKTCSGCGVMKETLSLHERVFHCSACGLSLDRDENAAINLRRYGVKELGIVPLPEGLREVTPDREEGSGSTLGRRVKPASVTQEATARRARGTTRRSTPNGVLVRFRGGTNPPAEYPHPRGPRSRARSGGSVGGRRG
jgi:putative transposase